MSTVPLLLIAIIVLVVFTIIYLSILDEAAENAFENRLAVYTEYLRRTNAEVPPPPFLGYVSDVYDNLFKVTYFDTANLAVIDASVHDDNYETFNFINQTFEQQKYTKNEPRIAPHSTDPAKFMARGDDDDWMEIDCPADNHFNSQTNRCEPVPPCYNKQPGLYPIDEKLLDTLVLNHRVPKQRDENVPNKYHPTMYLQCLMGGSHAVHECPPNHLFNIDSAECQIRNDCENRADGFIITPVPENLNINEYLECRNGDLNVTSCPAGEIFDRRLLMCVRGHPCTMFGDGYTYITDEINDNQFFRCTSHSESQLITCIRRVFANDQYECTGDDRCLVFENGSGIMPYVHNDGILEYDTGSLICDNYTIINDVICDNSNLLQNKLYYDKFVANIHLPKQIYNSANNSCVPFEIDRVKIVNDIFPINMIENDYKIDAQTALVGKTKNISSLMNDTNTLADVVVYARDSNSIGLNPVDGSFIECFGDYLYDIFDGKQINFCNDPMSATPSLRQTLDGKKYFQSIVVKVGSDSDYQQQCVRYLDEIDRNFVELDHFAASYIGDILHNDECSTLLTQIHDSYTTLSQKYTTLDSKYTYENVKNEKFVEQYGTNIHKNEHYDLQNEKDLQPLFDPFVKIETVRPLFNPFDMDSPPIIDSEPENDPEFNPNPVPEPEQEELILKNKTVNFACFYSLPIFKLSACHLNNESLIINIYNLRKKVDISADCINAAGLVNIVNSYAYLGNDIGCRCKYSTEKGLHIERDDNPIVYTNLDTQSNDGIKYNMYIHRNGNNFIACPPELLTDTFECNVENDRMYIMHNIQPE
ncbi:VP91 [Helicoverpa armigera SNPV]|nr:VP91 [Helicoverpa armigera SNPV]